MGQLKVTHQLGTIALLCMLAALIDVIVKLVRTYAPILFPRYWKDNTELMASYPRAFEGCNDCIGIEYNLELGFLMVSACLAIYGIAFYKPMYLVPWMLNAPMFPYLHYETVKCVHTEDAFLNHWPISSVKAHYVNRKYGSTPANPAVHLSPSDLSLKAPEIAASLPAFPASELAEFSNNAARTEPVYWSKEQGRPVFWDVARDTETDFKFDTLWRCPFAILNGEPRAQQKFTLIDVTLDSLAQLIIWAGTFIASVAFFVSALVEEAASYEINDSAIRYRARNQVTGIRDRVWEMSNSTQTTSHQQTQHPENEPIERDVDAPVILHPELLYLTSPV